jgi:hypothetical protein
MQYTIFGFFIEWNMKIVVDLQYHFFHSVVVLLNYQKN